MEKLSNLQPAEFSQRAADLLAEACPDDSSRVFFERNMTLASSMGMSWVEGLQFVIEQRRGLN